MKKTVIMTIALSAAALLSSCEGPENQGFKYTIDSFADLKVMRYQIPGWENLSLQQKEYAYHLAEAAKYGRDILWDQNCKENLRIRHAVEAILQADGIPTDSQEYQDFLVYAKRLFFSNGIHHHYAEDKFFPACPREYFASLLTAAGVADDGLLDIIYDPANDPGFVIVGNHDLFYDAWDAWLQTFHTSTYYYYVQTPSFKDIYIMLDSANGTLGEKQSAWLEDVLSNQRSGCRHCFGSSA